MAKPSRVQGLSKPSASARGQVFAIKKGAAYRREIDARRRCDFEMGFFDMAVDDGGIGAGKVERFFERGIHKISAAGRSGHKKRAVGILDDALNR